MPELDKNVIDCIITHRPPKDTNEVTAAIFRGRGNPPEQIAAHPLVISITPIKNGVIFSPKRRYIPVSPITSIIKVNTAIDAPTASIEATDDSIESPIKLSVFSDVFKYLSPLDFSGFTLQNNNPVNIAEQ